MNCEKKTTDVLEYAQQLYKRYHARCFWHVKPDLIITEAMLPLVLKGLRSHGGRASILDADRLEKEAK